MVDAAGEVVFCQLIDEVASDLDRMLATRLREHRLAPASAPGEMALAAGFVDVVVRQGAVAAEAVP
jgi:hypothetical protein